MDYWPRVHAGPPVLCAKYTGRPIDLICDSNCAALLRRRGAEAHAHVPVCHRAGPVHGCGDCIYRQLPPPVRPGARQFSPYEASFYPPQSLPGAIHWDLVLSAGWMYYILCLHRLSHCREPLSTISSPHFLI